MIQEKKKLFSKKNTAFDNLPPTSAALKYHIQRAVYQASIVWGQSLINTPIYHSPEQWGWKKKVLMVHLKLYGLI